ncbi:t-SNARE [Pilobolus umbonatus]|nr:t-SNARE [Pilobolus umbonatus]
MSFNDIESSINPPSRDNDDVEYKEVTQKIAQQLFHINGNISHIERLVRMLGGNKDTIEMRNTLHDITMATQELVKATTHDIKSLSNYFHISHHKQSKQRRLEQQKLTKDFQTILSHFQTIQKQSMNKQREYVDKVEGTSIMMQSRDEQEEVSAALMDSHRQQQQQQIDTLNNEVDYNELLISERENEIENIEQGINDLNEVFRDMSMIVNEQESGIQSIYGNIVQIVNYTRQAGDELVVASNYQRRTRRSMCCFLLMITLICSIISFIIIVAK